MKTPDDEVTASALRPFYERDELPLAVSRSAAQIEMIPSELASFAADVRRIIALLDQLDSPAETITAYLGVQSQAVGTEAGSSPLRTAVALAAAGPVKRPNSATPNLQSPAKSWAMRRFS